MSRKYKIRDQEQLYFLSFATVHWIDVFTRPLYKDILIESLEFCQKNKGLDIFAYVIMTNHVHLIVGRSGKQKIEEIIRDFKKFTAYKLLKTIAENNQESRKEWILWMMARAGKKNPNNKNYQFWQQNNHPIALTSNKILEQKLEYIHNNPVEQGIVSEPEDYLYSSAKNYAGLVDIMLTVILIE